MKYRKKRDKVTKAWPNREMQQHFSAPVAGSRYGFKSTHIAWELRLINYYRATVCFIVFIFYLFSLVHSDIVIDVFIGLVSGLLSVHYGAF